MPLSERLRTFPVIAAIAVSIALLLGVFFGSGANKVRPMPISGEVEDNTLDTPSGKRSSRSTDSGNSGRGSSSAKTDGGTESSGRDKTRPDGTKPGETTKPRNTGTKPIGTAKPDWSRPKELKEGRKDGLVTQIQLPVPQGSILVTVKTSTEYSVQQAILRLDIDAPPLGYQLVQSRAEPTGEPGDYRFSGLFPGSYLVTCSMPGFAEATAKAELRGGVQEEQVKIVLGTPTWTRVSFGFSFADDNTKPTQVYVQRSEKSARDSITTGRFGRVGNAPPDTSLAGNSSISTYVIPDDTGLLVFAVRVGMRESFIFSATRDTRRYRAEAAVLGKEGEEMRVDVSLVLLDVNAPDPTGGNMPRASVRFEATFTRSDGVAVTLKRCNLRQSLEAATYTSASTLESNKAIFANLQPGHWYLVAEADGLAAPWVRQLSVLENTNQAYMIELGQLTVHATRDNASPPPEGTRLTYRVALRPLGSGTMGSSYSREIPAGAQTDIATYTLPIGQYTIAMDSNDTLLALEPPTVSLTLALEAEADLSFTLRAAATLEFMAVDSAVTPVPGVEYLISFHPAGEIPETEQAKVQLGGADGRCKQIGLVYGSVYLHVWSTSRDFQNPDRSFQIELPSYGTLNLGSLTVR